MNRIKNQIHRWLKIYFPEFTKVFGSFEGQSSLLILEAAPTPSEILSLGAEAINQIWRNKKIRAVGIKRATTLYDAAKSTIGCTEGSAAARLEISLLLEDYRNKMKQYATIMETIETLCEQIPEVAKLLEIKGVGIVTVSGFISEVGDVKRFKSAKQIQKLAGLALKESSSGKSKGKTSISKRGRSRLRAILFQAVMPLIAKNKEFGEIHRYYTNIGINPLKKKQSIIAISCKLIRVFFALLTTGRTYRPDKLIRDISRPEEMKTIRAGSQSESPPSERIATRYMSITDTHLVDRRN